MAGVIERLTHVTNPVSSVFEPAGTWAVTGRHERVPIRAHYPLDSADPTLIPPLIHKPRFGLYRPIFGLCRPKRRYPLDSADQTNNLKQLNFK